MHSAGRIRQKILFFRQGGFSHINDRVAVQLREKFPDFDFEQIDVLQGIVKPAHAMVLRNALQTLLEYAADIATCRRTARECFYRTPYFFHAVRRLIAKKFGASRTEYAFSFQTQSLYDASIDGLPHFVLTDHTHLANTSYPVFDPTHLFPQRWIDLERTIYQRAAKTFVMGKHVRDSLIRHYGCPPERAVWVGAGGNLPEPTQPPDNDGYKNKRILFVGVDWQRKGGPQLVEAFKLVREKIPDARLAIVGCSPQIDTPNVEILGKIPLAAVSDQLRKSTLLALPSQIEPMGVNLIEAGLHRIPVVATSIGAIPDMVPEGRSGFLVAPNDIRGLADALLKLLTDPQLCRELGEHAYQFVKQNYTWDLVGERIRKEIVAVVPIQ